MQNNQRRLRAIAAGNDALSWKPYYTPWSDDSGGDGKIRVGWLDAPATQAPSTSGKGIKTTKLAVNLQTNTW